MEASVGRMRGACGYSCSVYEAIIFDNDGVLVDTEGLYFAANRDILAGVGVVLDQDAYVELFLRQGIGAWHLAEAIGQSPDRITALRRSRDLRYLALVERADITIPGVAEILPALAKRYRMAIVTSADPEPFARTHMRTGLLKHFEFALTRVDYTLSKPEPEPYLRAVERLGLPPDRCLVIEDSERGLFSARAAGLRCWVIPSTFTKGCRFEGADAVLESLGSAAARLLDC
jgi:HAD superfamily hydrolase (TIGR01509 family)